MDEKEFEKLYILIEKQIDNLLSDEEAQALEKMIVDHPEARSLYMDITTQNALFYERGLSSDNEEKSATPKTIIRYRLALLATAAAIVLMFSINLKETKQQTSIATLTKTEDCIWMGSSLPTTPGSKLYAGSLNLLKGLATIKFSSGAEMIIEAPAEVELLNAMHCLVKQGTVMADIPESAHGFTIDTPQMKAIDHGTKFIVSYNQKSEKSLVEVLEGEVEVKSLALGESQRFFEGHTALVNKNKLTTTNALSERKLTSNTDKKMQDTIKIRTDDGRGMDQSIDLDKGTKNKSVNYLTVKNTEGSLQRKAYLKFDMVKLGTTPINNVTLHLKAVPSDYGSPSLIPEVSKFTVYGLTNEALDNWNEKTLTWENAPANIPKKNNALDMSKVTKVGEFQLKRSVQDEVISITDEALKNFISTDSNGLITLIIVRETGEFHPNGLVHTFASKEHPVGYPPTLEFEINQ
jgi:hypothetical protein